MAGRDDDLVLRTVELAREVIQHGMGTDHDRETRAAPPLRTRNTYT
jgi:hypothetical protein